MDKAHIVFEKLGKFYKPLVVTFDRLGKGAKSLGGFSLSRKNLQKHFKEIWQGEKAMRPQLEKALKENKGIIGLAKRHKDNRFILRHELAHSLRENKNKLSQKYYKFLPFNFIEELAANRAALKKIKEVPKGLKTPAAVAMSGVQTVIQRPVQSAVLATGAIAGTSIVANEREAKMYKSAQVYQKIRKPLIAIIKADHLSPGAGAAYISDKYVKYFKHTLPEGKKALADKAIKEGKGLILATEDLRKAKDFGGRYMLRHELVHSIRDTKRKLSGILYPILPFKAIEESAANIGATRRQLPNGIRHVLGVGLGTGQAIVKSPIQSTIAAGGLITGKVLYDKKSKKHMLKTSQVYKKIKNTPTSKAIDMLSDEWFFRKPPKGVRKEVNVVGRVKSAGLFDRIANKMAPDIWLPDGSHLLPNVRDYILRTLYSFVPKKDVVQIVLIGSITGLQWQYDSDIDVNAVLPTKEQVERLWEVRREHNEKNIPGTKHPLNIYLQSLPENGEIPTYEDSYFGVYDILNDRWLVDPPDASTYRPYRDKFWAELKTARMLTHEFMRRADNYEKSVKDNLELQKKGPSTPWDLIKSEARVARDFKELTDFIDEIQHGRDFAYNWGWGIARVGYRNVVYKFIHEMLPTKYENILNEVEELHHKSKFSDGSIQVKGDT